MVNLEIDNKKLDKERKKMEKEERRLRIEQEKALRQQNKKIKAPKDANNSGQTKFEKYKDNKMAKKIITIAGIIAVVGLGIVCKDLVSSYVESVKNETAMKENETVMVNVIGYDIESAKKELENHEIKYTIIKQPDTFNLDGNVIKTEINPGSFVNKEKSVKIYVCDNAELDTTTPHDVTTDKTPFVKDNLDVVSFYTSDDMFCIVIQNNNNVTITEIEYTIGYLDMLNFKIGDKIYKEFDLNIQPGEKYILSNKINNNKAYSLTIEKFNCSIYKAEEK